MKFTALNKRIIARETVSREDTSGMYIPKAAQEAPTEATVESVGSAVQDIKIGDHIVYEPTLAKKTQLKGVEYLIINEEDVLAKVEA